MNHVFCQLSAGHPIENKSLREPRKERGCPTLSYQESNEDKGLSTGS